MESLFSAEPPEGSTAWRLKQEGYKDQEYRITVRMIKKGYSNEAISEITERSIEEVEKIRKEVNSSE